MSVPDILPTHHRLYMGYLSKPQSGNILLDNIPAETRVCNPNAFELEVRIRMFVEVIRDVWDV